MSQTDFLEEGYIAIAKKAQESWASDTQAVELFNQHIMTVISLACPLDFRLRDHDDRALTTRKVLGNLMIAMYAVRLMTPSEDDLKGMAEAMRPNVANDALLCAALITRGASDAFLFFHEADQELNRDLIRCMGETLSGVYLLCNLLQIELSSSTPLL